MEKSKIKDQKSKIGNAKQKPEVKAEVVPTKQEARAVGRYLRISPTKVRDWVRLIRGKRIAEAETILKFSGTRGGEAVGEVLHSAGANAGAGFDKNTWVIAEARADQGPIFRRRVDPKSRGSRGLITTPSTHLKIVIRERKTVNRGEHGQMETRSSAFNREAVANEQMSKSATKRSSNGS
ncbi:MAG: uL22 family ribosomal protein [candidate division WWE3 bacterium]|nr:uL22 family ribosomal protein [candidate division WWE3 bacterium]